MVHLRYEGRLANNIIQYFAAYQLAAKKKTTLKVEAKTSENFGLILGIEELPPRWESGKLDHIDVYDHNYMNVLKTDMNVDSFSLHDYFQLKEFLVKYESAIKNSLNIEYEKREEVFVHYRIGDIAGSKWMLPFDYYDDALKSVPCNSGFISSDSIGHENCLRLIEKYKLTPVYKLSPLQTILFGKNFSTIITSGGTFSWMIAFLSKAKRIIYTKKNSGWYGDIFFDRWECR